MSTPTALAELDPATLRALAAAIEGQDPERRARRELTDEGREKLADLLLAGGKPTVGFFRRHRRVPDLDVERVQHLPGVEPAVAS